MKNNNLNLEDIILILIIFYSLYLLLCINKNRNKDNFTNIDNLQDNLKILSNIADESNKNNGYIRFNTDGDVQLNNTIVDKIELYNNNFNNYNDDYKGDVLNKDTEYIPIGTITNFTGDIKNIPKTWAVCDGYYYLYSNFSIKNNFVLINKDDDRKILDEYNFGEDFDFKNGIPHLKYIPENYKQYFFKTPNLIGRTVYGIDLNEENNLNTRYDKNSGEVKYMLNHNQINYHTHFSVKNGIRQVKWNDINASNAVSSGSYGRHTGIRFTGSYGTVNEMLSSMYKKLTILLPPWYGYKTRYDEITNSIKLTGKTSNLNSEVDERFIQKKINVLPNSIGLYWIIKI